MTKIKWLTSLVCLMMSTRAIAAESPSVHDARSYVRPIDAKVFAQRYRELPNRDRDLIGLYMEGARRTVLTFEDGCNPAPGNLQWLNIAERAHGAAVLAEMPSDWPDELRERCRTEAAAWVGEFAAEYLKD